MKSVLQPWVMEIGLRHQGVLVSAMRGCDIAPRHDPSKLAQRIMRGAILEPHAGRLANPKTYIWRVENDQTWWQHMSAFLGNWDQYPNHYVVHFIHAAEVIGYCGPDIFPVYARRWARFYYDACHILHLNPETKEQLDFRLNADEATFAKLQQHEVNPDPEA